MPLCQTFVFLLKSPCEVRKVLSQLCNSDGPGPRTDSSGQWVFFAVINNILPCIVDVGVYIISGEERVGHSPYIRDCYVGHMLAMAPCSA